MQLYRSALANLLLSRLLQKKKKGMLCKYCLSLSIWTLITINLLCFFYGVLKEEPGGSKSSTSDNNPVTEIGLWNNIFKDS